MRCRVPGLHSELEAKREILEGTFLVQVDGVSYRYQTQKPFLLLTFAVVEPMEVAGQSFTGRLYCTPKALWKLRWFLRDFGYDTELFGTDVIEEKALRGLRGIVKISQFRSNGHSYLNLDGFAPASTWEEVQTGRGGQKSREGTDDV